MSRNGKHVDITKSLELMLKLFSNLYKFQREIFLRGIAPNLNALGTPFLCVFLFENSDSKSQLFLFLDELIEAAAFQPCQLHCLSCGQFSALP